MIILNINKLKVDGYVQITFNDIHGLEHLHLFKDYRINDKKYHVVRFSIFDFNSTLTVDGNYATKETMSQKGLLKKYLNKNYIYF